MLDHYDVFFRRAEVNFVPGPGAVVPPIATTDGVNFDRRPAPEERARASGLSEEVVARSGPLLPRQVDQDDVGVLPEAVEHDVFPVRRDVEPSQVSLVAETCDLTSLARDEIEQPEVQRFRSWPVHEMRLVQEAIAAGADPQVFPCPGLAGHEWEIVLRAIESHGLQRSARLARGGRASGKRPEYTMKSPLGDQTGSVARPERGDEAFLRPRGWRTGRSPLRAGLLRRSSRPSGDQSGVPCMSMRDGEGLRALAVLVHHRQVPVSRLLDDDGHPASVGRRRRRLDQVPFRALGDLERRRLEAPHPVA